jgi:Fe2+ or Zn2+ uptake regulation protein
MADPTAPDASAQNTESSPSLRAAGLRQTPQWEAILRVLNESDRPLSAEEVWRSMGGQQSGLPTVYRNLERFAQEGWAEGILGRDQVLRFVRCRSADHHHHLECEACGRTVEVQSCGLEATLEGMERASGFRITRHQLQLFGLCPLCREKAR